MFESIIVQPLLNILFVIDAAVPGNDFGVSVVILTLLIRFALYPLASKQLHSQKALSAIQPDIDRLKKKHKNNPKALHEATLELYKEKEIKPFASCLPLLIQMPFLLGLFYVFLKFRETSFLALTEEGILGQIYPFVEEISFVSHFIASNDTLSTVSLGLVDLSQPVIPLAIAAGALQFVQSKMLMPKKKSEDPTAKMMAQMLYIFPILTIAVAITLPSALPLYWSVTTIFAIVQQYFIINRDVEKLEEKDERKPAKKSKKNRK